MSAGKISEVGANIDVKSTVLLPSQTAIQPRMDGQVSPVIR